MVKIKVTLWNFSEESYLRSNPDVVNAVKNHQFRSGRAHFFAHGIRENRTMEVRGKENIKNNQFLSECSSLFKRIIICNEGKNDEINIRQIIAKEFISGCGIEIGALQNPLPLSKEVRVRYVDRLTVEELRMHYPELNNMPLVDVEIISNGETLENIADNSQDFVIANHFLEHCQNPILTLENFYRVLRNSGILFLAVPDKRFTFDKNREVTSYDHLLKDYSLGALSSRKQHFEDWVKYVNNISDKQEILNKVSELISSNYSIHYHVWTQIEILELCLKQAMIFRWEIELIRKNGFELIVILRKT